MTRDVRVVARSKLTLSLRILGVRPDGFHELEALVVSLRDPHDVVGLRIQAPFGVRVRLSGRAVVGVPADESNLAARAARLLLEAAAEGEDPGPWAASGLDISLHKAIPAGAGLGGGSADAAGTLVGGSRLLGLGLDPAALAALGAELGSDIPFCVTGGLAWMRGRGELIEPLPFPASAGSPSGPSLWGGGGVQAGPGPSWGDAWAALQEPEGPAFVVAVPPFPLATPAVYRAWDELGGPSGKRSVPLPDGLRGPGLPEALVNDLEPAAEHVDPRLREFREALEALTGAPALLAGSGSSYFFVCANSAAAEAAAGIRSTISGSWAFVAGVAG